MNSRSVRQIGVWIFIIFVAGLFGAIGGRIVGYILYRLSYHYTVIPQEHQDWGLRFGLFVGTILTASHKLGRRQPFSLVQLLLGLVLVATITGTGIGLGGLIAHTAYQTGLWQPSNWRLPNPDRHAIFLGALTGRNWGAGLGVIFTVLWLRVFPQHIKSNSVSRLN
ncbi:hypothetical protein SR1949_49640 [Sphaerospermopsis reniformis]|uniref:Uncharacterized protein n=1 Tax=Sphaerospermopsis reniformis TaxID=531300 RepID=A0A480ACH2_9CYAN|nr:hypothetical protein [Sphaerospermopsis reniformis]GCL39834.1 hypothetical protein SR1949_49640 [Sphaerospermopsis reniformis]